MGLPPPTDAWETEGPYMPVEIATSTVAAPHHYSDNTTSGWSKRRQVKEQKRQQQGGGGGLLDGSDAAAEAFDYDEVGSVGSGGSIRTPHTARYRAWNKLICG